MIKRNWTLIVLLILLPAILLSGCGKESSKKVKLIDISLTDEEYAFGVDKSQPGLIILAIFLIQ